MSLAIPNSISFSPDTGDGYLLPAELWSIIFAKLDSNTMTEVSLTCSTFRRLVQPLLFSQLMFWPHSGAGRAGLDRLEAYASDTIAPVVRECYLLTTTRALAPGFLVHFFDTLPLFSNLSRLSLKRVDITHERLAQVELLPRLTYVSFEDCFSTALNLPKTSHRDLHLSVHTTRSSVFRTRSDIEYVSLWTAFINPDSMRSLKVLPDEDDTNFFYPILSTVGVFRTLKVLHLAVTHDSDLRFLAYCPDLRDLRLKSVTISDNSLPWELPSSWVPELEMYGGPLGLFFSSVVRGRQLRHLELTTNDMIEEGLSGLRKFGASVESLFIHATVLAEASLIAIWETFPNLKGTVIFADKYGRDWPRPDDRSRLVSGFNDVKLSSNLQHLDVYVGSVEQKPKPSEIQATFALCKDLRYLSLGPFLENESCTFNPSTGLQEGPSDYIYTAFYRWRDSVLPAWL